MSESPPSWIEAIVGTLFNPGGDPDAIRRAEASVRALAEQVTSKTVALKPVAKDLHDGWDGLASEAFQKAWREYSDNLQGYVKHLVEAADGMVKLADFLEDAQGQAKTFWIMIGATLATGVAFAIFTAGMSEAAAVAAAATELSGLAALAARMAFVFSSQALAMGVIQSAILTIIARLAMGMAFSLVATVFVKGVVQDLNVLDPASWNASDASKILLDGAFVIGMGGVASIPGVARKLAGPTGIPTFRRQLLGAAAFGGPASALFASIGQFGFQGKSFTDLKAWQDIGKSFFVGTGIGSAALVYGPGRVFGSTFKTGNVTPTISPIPTLRRTVIVASDWVWSSLAFPSDAINYFINYPVVTPVPRLPDFAGPAAVGTAAIDPAKYPQPAPSRPPISSAVTVRAGGDSLWAIAQRVYGDGDQYRRIAEANSISPPYTIFRGQRLTIPSLPTGVP